MPCKKNSLRLLLPVLLFTLLSSLAASVSADVCVWRDPERTMIKLFPQAKDYKTEVYKLNPTQITAIEKLVGEPLQASEKKEYNIYTITGDGSDKGSVLALAGTGEYGVIETVVGLNADHSIRGVYLQRVRERKRKALKSPAFLGQFTGKTITITGRFGGMCADGADFYFKDKLDLIEVIPPAAGLPDDVVIGTPLKIQGVVMVRGGHEEEGEEQEHQEHTGEAGDEADHETTGEAGDEVEPEVKIRAVVIQTNRS